VLVVGPVVGDGFSPAEENRCSARNPPTLSTRMLPRTQKMKFGGMPGGPFSSAAARSSGAGEVVEVEADA
jgi:hypothetical protein